MKRWASWSSVVVASALVGCGDDATEASGPSSTQATSVATTTTGGSNAGGSNVGGSDGGATMGGGGTGGDVASGGAPPTGPLTYENIVLDVSGDPDCSFFDGAYHLYLPRQIHEGGAGVGGKVVSYRSTDLVEWKAMGSVFDNVDDAYGGDHTTGMWAPEVLAFGGKYYLYYVNVMSGGDDADVGNKDIAVVTSSDPDDFTKSTDKKILFDNAFAFIDPSPFVDPDTGKLWLVYKRRDESGTGSRLVIHEMASPTTLIGGPTTLLDKSQVAGVGQLEHPMLTKAGNVYYLLYSYGEGDEPTYRISYATADKPNGPYTQRGVVFASDGNLSGGLGKKIIAPGAASIVEDGLGKTWMVYRQKKTAEKTFADRGVCIDPVDFKPAQHALVGKPTKGTVEPGPSF